MDKSFSNMAPKSINQLDAIYSVLNPLNIKVDGVGSFGTVDGTVALAKRKVEILFPVVKEIKTIKKFLKKDKEKGWLYETSY